MAKQTTRLNIKGMLDIDNGEILEFDKDIGEIKHKIHELLLPFNGIDDVTLTVSYDKVIEGKVE